MSSKSYANDLFISYAHIDNAFFPGGSKGWIDMLHERLEIRLAQLLGKKPNIWRDRKLRGYDDFEETLVIQLSQSAILLVVVTPFHTCVQLTPAFVLFHKPLFLVAQKRMLLLFGSTARRSPLALP